MYGYLDRRYALAFYQVAEEKGRVDDYLNELRQVVNLINTNEDLIQIINHPQISTSKKKDLFRQVFSNQINKDLLSFLLILIDKDRVSTLSGILDEAEKIHLQKNNTVVAQIKTVIPLNTQEKVNLIEKLQSKYNKNILLKEEIDNSVIGGVYVRIGDEVIDGTVKHKLEVMHKLMLKDKLDVVKE